MRHRLLLALLGCAFASALVVGAGGGATTQSRTVRVHSMGAAAGPRVSITTFSDRRVIGANGIAAGPDGALWFTTSYEDRDTTPRNVIGRITTRGAITVYRNERLGGPQEIVAGPDGALWFTNNQTDYHGGESAIGRITTKGAITLYPHAVTNLWVSGITVGPDGALWYTEPDSSFSRIGRMTVRGTVSHYRLHADSWAITAGPDGALWFTSAGSDDWTVPQNAPGVIGRITTKGAVTLYRDKRIHQYADITRGPDGALWFTNGDSIGRITSKGAITIYKDKGTRGAQSITTGPDRALWFTAGNSIGRLRILSSG